MTEDFDLHVPFNPRTYHQDVAWARLQRQRTERLVRDMDTYRDAIQAEMKRANAAGQAINLLTLPDRVILAERLKEAGYTHEAAYAASARMNGT